MDSGKEDRRKTRITRAKRRSQNKRTNEDEENRSCTRGISCASSALDCEAKLTEILSLLQQLLLLMLPPPAKIMIMRRIYSANLDCLMSTAAFQVANGRYLEFPLDIKVNKSR